MSAAMSAATADRAPGGERAELPELAERDRLRLAARVALGLEPGILLRLRGMRPAELIFQGSSATDLRISMDADLRALPRLGAEYLLPVDPFTVPARAWADALLAAAVEVPRPEISAQGDQQRAELRAGRAGTSAPRRRRTRQGRAS